MPRILAVDDDRQFRRSLSRTLADFGFDVVEADDGVDGTEKLLENTFDLVITDLNMPRADGFAVIRAVHRHAGKTPVVMLTGSTTVDCVAAMRAGATNFLMKPFNPVELERVVREALLASSPDEDRTSRRPQAALVGQSQPLREALERVDAFARGGAIAILIEAERGAGTEAFARLVHGVSSRAGRPFVALAGVLCDPDALLAGAQRADGGTLFIDDVSVLGAPAQAMLAELITRGTTRVVASTERALAELVSENTFDLQLAQVLAEAKISLPPLRERPEDVPALVQHFLDEANRRHGGSVELEGATIGALQAYRFPGNVGELESMVDKLVRRSTGRKRPVIEDEPEMEVSVEQTDVSLLLHDGSRHNVTLVLVGGQTVESLLLTPDSFLLVQDEGRTRHYARSSIAMISNESDPPAVDHLPRRAARVRVRLLSGRTIDGHMRWVPGVARQTASSVLCEPAAIFVVHADGATCFIAKSHVAWVEEQP
jgi:DNA-binding NtrC family response regulator